MIFKLGYEVMNNNLEMGYEVMRNLDGFKVMNGNVDGL